MEKFVATALVVGIIGPLFWLCVGVLENRIRRVLSLLGHRWRCYKSAKQASRAHRRLL